VVDVPDRSHVHVRLRSLKFLLCHILNGSSYNYLRSDNNGYKHAAAVP
jgi:hypothetical protein